MFIAHFPAGYLTATTAQRFGLWTRGIMASSFMGAHFPDVDLFYWHLVDNGEIHHHLYWTHYPIVWLVLLLLSLAACWKTGGKPWALIAAFFSGNALLHLFLDCIAGDIPLLAPWNMQLYSCVSVERVYEPWWLNFLLHWTILVELAIVFAALGVFLHRCRRRVLAWRQ